MPLTLAAWLHDIGPFIFQVGEGWGIRWYGVSYALGLVAGWAMLRFFHARGVTPLTPQRISDAMILLVIGVVAGGRLGYVLFYQPSLLIEFRNPLPWWGVLRVTDGGMASHGGIIGVIIATYFISRGPRDKTGKHPQYVYWPHILDLVAVACTPGLMFGRLANFINGELLGEIVAMPGQPAPRWAVKFPQEVFSGHSPTPDQIDNLLPLLDQYRLNNQSDGAAYDRMLRALHKGGEEGSRIAEQLAPYISARHPSQLYQAAAEGLALGGVLLLIWAKPRLAGVIGCWFLITYGVLRVATEFIRLPDPDAPRHLGLSRGQLLSVLMLAAGVILLPVVIRKGGPVFPGWWRRTSPSVNAKLPPAF